HAVPAPLPAPDARSPSLSFYCSPAHPDLHSFPTRRSSDLSKRTRAQVVAPARTLTTTTVPPFVWAWRSGVRRYRQTPLRQAQTKDRKSTRLNSSHVANSYAVFCLKKKKRPTDSAELRVLRH